MTIVIEGAAGATILIDARRMATCTACKQPTAIEKKLDFIIQHMAKPEDVKAAAEDVKAAVAQEKTEIAAKLADLETTITTLKEQIATGDNPALDESVALLTAQAAEIRAIITPPVVDEEA